MCACSKSKGLFDAFDRLLNASLRLLESVKAAMEGDEDTAIVDEYLVNMNATDLEMVLSEAIDIASAHRSDDGRTTGTFESKCAFFYCGRCDTIGVVLREMIVVPKDHWFDEKKPEFWYHVYCPAEEEYFNKRMTLDQLFPVKKVHI